ncbi:unnamed protein product [Cylicostephanus goldi]|uniref:Uncharacterized protein n=1 Tax=Cylicostephanus goldi TaxID=71465 RepID=A0A3P6QI73_CYLGO|nr:unnamed protein product [Cylicostephanus goldi]
MLFYIDFVLNTFRIVLTDTLYLDMPKDSDLTDFVPDELCLLCDRQRQELAANLRERQLLMCESDSGVCSSASPPTSPRASQPVPSASTEATLLGMTNLYERTREAIMRMQAAQQCEF